MPGECNCNARWLYGILAEECQHSKDGVYVFTSQELHHDHVLDGFCVPKLLTCLSDVGFIVHYVKCHKQSGHHKYYHFVATDITIDVEEVAKRFTPARVEPQEQAHPEIPEELMSMIPDGWKVMFSRLTPVQYYAYKADDHKKKDRRYLGNENTIWKLTQEQVAAKLKVEVAV